MVRQVVLWFKGMKLPQGFVQHLVKLKDPLWPLSSPLLCWETPPPLHDWLLWCDAVEQTFFFICVLLWNQTPDLVKMQPNRRCCHFLAATTNSVYMLSVSVQKVTRVMFPLRKAKTNFKKHVSEWKELQQSLQKMFCICLPVVLQMYVVWVKI